MSVAGDLAWHPASDGISPGWRQPMTTFKAHQAFLQAARAYARIRDAHAEGVHNVDVELAVTERELEQAALAWAGALTPAQKATIGKGSKHIPSPSQVAARILAHATAISYTDRRRWKRPRVLVDYSRAGQRVRTSFSGSEELTISAVVTHMPTGVPMMHLTDANGEMVVAAGTHEVVEVISPARPSLLRAFGLMLALVVALAASACSPANARPTEETKQAQQYKEAATSCPAGRALFLHRGVRGPDSDRRLRTYRGCIKYPEDCSYLAKTMNDSPQERLSLWFCR